MSLIDSLVDLYEWVFDLKEDNDVKLDYRKFQKTAADINDKTQVQKQRKVVKIHGIITNLGPSFGYINDTLYFPYSKLSSKIRPEMPSGLKIKLSVYASSKV